MSIFFQLNKMKISLSEIKIFIRRRVTLLSFFIVLVLGVESCITPNNNTKVQGADVSTILEVEKAYFTAANPNIQVNTVPCTLSDGTKTQCYQIITNSTPVDHQMGPWCPDNISDDASAGGIWLEDGEVYDVDGEFIRNLAVLYNDDTWRMYDADGKIYVTRTKEDCVNAANPNVGEEYRNYCVECIPSYITDVSRTWLIPITPVLIDNPEFFQRGPRGPGGAGRPPNRPDRPEAPGERPKRPGGPDGLGDMIPSTRGIALNGVEFSAPAPVNNILSAYTLAPFDDAGGHINVHQGYHYHAATGMSYSVAQSDEHAPLIGYALDGHGIYARLDKKGSEPADLDDCRGHYDDIRGYHYHVDAAGNNNFINCLKGAYVN